MGGGGEFSQQEIGGQSKTEVVEQKLASRRWGEEEREMELGEKGDGEKKKLSTKGRNEKRDHLCVSLKSLKC